MSNASWHGSRPRFGVRLAAVAGAVAITASACGASAPSAATPVTTLGASGTPTPASPAVSAGSSAQEPQALLDTAREAYGAPGALALIVDGDARIFLASGHADTAGTPITDTTRFRIASITKPVVAALVLDAVARGEVRLDDVVGELLPGLLRAEPPVTVRQLLDHTSGIFDESNGVATREALEADVARLADPELRAEAARDLDEAAAGSRVIASDRLLVALSETHERHFPPGTGYAYSNTNYQVAAMVLEKATGMALADLLQERLAAPLDLTRMSIAPPDTASPELRGYGRGADGSLVDRTDDLTWFGNGGNGGIISTADDLLTVLRAVVGGTYLPADLTSAMLTPNKGSYGLGIGTYGFRCGVFYGHQGAVNGTTSIAVASQDGRRGAVIAFDLRDGADPPLVPLVHDLLCPPE